MYFWEIKDFNNKKLRRKEWGPFVYVENLKHNKEFNTFVRCVNYDELFLNDWEEYEQPKKIKMYRHTKKDVNGFVFQDKWVCSKEIRLSGGEKILKIEEKEVEL